MKISENESIERGQGKERENERERAGLSISLKRVPGLKGQLEWDDSTLIQVLQTIFNKQTYFLNNSVCRFVPDPKGKGLCVF